MTKAALVLVLSVTLAGPSCSDSGESPPRVMPGTAPVASTADRTDAKSVAIAFLRAAARGEMDAAASYVIEQERERFKSGFKPPPGLPLEPEVEVTLKEVDGVKRADVNVRNVSKRVGLDMKLDGGQWWITR